FQQPQLQNRDQKMKGFVFTITLAALVAVASSLDCYVCSDCQPNFINSVTGSDVETCPSDLFVTPRCVKEFGTTGIVNRRCGTTIDCAAEMVNKCDGDADLLCIACCESDTCNGSATVKISAFALLIVAVLQKCMF
uniref:hypothetical protein n=1 Tax=Salmonella sp. S146_54837 TaxID=2665635 RepID=UPI001CA84078